MSPVIEMTGQSFGLLRVLERVPAAPGSKAARWRCVCECGSEVDARGVDLRKGHRRSCGCLKRSKAQTNYTQGGVVKQAKDHSHITQASRWRLKEIDGLTFVVGSVLDEVIVEFDGDVWTCSEHGSFPQPKTSAPVTCAHIVGCTRDMPPEVAWEICSLITPRREATGTTRPPTFQVIEDARPPMARAESKARQDRHAAHDDEHRRVTAEVTVRQATPEDLERLAERRRRKTIGTDKGRPATPRLRLPGHPAGRGTQRKPPDSPQQLLVGS